MHFFKHLNFDVLLSQNQHKPRKSYWVENFSTNQINMWTSKQMCHQVNLNTCVQTTEGKERKWRAENY